ncbi:hypothetical protein BDY17DRAFT_202700 [Neohortaea acidophila]|uniref:Hemerythrin-like domain-containing protein n=1 Tax=Neohortaea acidophila TaxID=245834 RepID=A0A6A6PLI0_9PEZI|nr:uncharacterized protein BDY17DRAFT_202700 [Neohortaea acidophila]KAF2480930.1 hypothetical protein BDY17DRAFT_202700 [Neohortaea acidophila]
MTTKPSDAPWADEPYKLLATPSQANHDEHAYLYTASEMTHAHNAVIRGLNAIVQQAPHVPDATDKAYNERDVKDLLFYVKSWTKMVNHHHWVEESFIFPEIEKIPGCSGMTKDPRHQHDLFHPGMDRLLAYAESTKPAEYRWNGDDGMKEIIDSFAQYLTDHLHAEIDVFLGMKDVDSASLRRAWDHGEVVAKQTGNIGMLYDVFPAVLGAIDKTYEGGHPFPPLPWVLPYLIKYWFAAGNGAWRFNPCDFWGRPRPLHFALQPRL